MAVINAAIRGEVLCSPRVAASLLRQVADVASERSRVPAIECLTSRELQVIHLMQEGLTNKEIAKRLSIALATVKNHVHNILKKLDLPRRAQAAALVRSRLGY